MRRISASSAPTRLTALALACVLGGASPAHAEDKDSVEQVRATTMTLIQALIDAGLLTREKADEIVRQSAAKAQAGAAGATPAAPATPAEAAANTPAEAPKAKVVRVPYITEAAKAELHDQLKKEVLTQARDERWGDPGALPAWLRSITVEGDLRVRHERDLFDKANNPPMDVQGGFANQTSARNPLAWAPDLTNTLTDRDRFTLRGRLGIKTRLDEDVSAGLRLSTGTTTNPMSVSQTQGNYFNKYTASIDQAYLKYQHEGWVSASAGRFANPFFGTDLTWPDDVNFDGVSASLRQGLGAGHAAFATVGAFPLQEFDTSRRDKWLYGAQLGGTFNLAQAVQFRTAAALYDFQHIEGQSDTNVGVGTILRPNLLTEYPTAVRQKGNTLMIINNGGTGQMGDDASNPATWGLASKFKPLNITAELAFLQFYPVVVKVQADYIRNLGFDLQDIYSRAAGSGVVGLPIAKKTGAMQLRVVAGHERIDHEGQWTGFVALRRLERDAWVDAFTDTTWHLGGTNYQGWSIGGQYGVATRTSLGGRWTSTRNLADPTLYNGAPGFSDAKLKIDVLQVELNTRF